MDSSDPEWWGGNPSSSSSDISSYVQAAIAALGGNGGTLNFPQPSKYWFKNIVTGSKLTVNCAIGAELHPTTGYGINDFLFANNIIGAETSTLNLGTGCLFVGDRASYSGGAGDGNNVALLLDGASNVEIHGAYEGWHTDAIYLGCQGGSSGSVPGDNILIGSDVKVTNSRRNNISIVCGTNVRLNGPYLAYAGSTVSGQLGTAPYASIDIEPDSATNVVEKITGSFTSLNPAGNHLDVVEQFISRPNIGVDLSCVSCTGAGGHGVIVTDFSTGHVLGGVTISGNFSNNGTSGAGHASVLFAGSVTNCTVSGIFNEANTGVMALMMYGTNNTIGDGYYEGQAYDMLVDAGATGNQISTGAVLKSGKFNPAGTGQLTPVVPGPMGLGDLVLRLAATGRISEGFGHVLAGESPGQTELRVVSGVGGFGAMARWLTAAARAQVRAVQGAS